MLGTGSVRSFCVFLPCDGYNILFLGRKRAMVFPLLLFRQPIIVIQAVWYGFYVFHMYVGCLLLGRSDCRATYDGLVVE